MVYANFKKLFKIQFKLDTRALYFKPTDLRIIFNNLSKNIVPHILFPIWIPCKAPQKTFCHNSNIFHNISTISTILSKLNPLKALSLAYCWKQSIDDPFLCFHVSPQPSPIHFKNTRQYLTYVNEKYRQFAYITNMLYENAWEKSYGYENVEKWSAVASAKYKFNTNFQ